MYASMAGLAVPIRPAVSWMPLCSQSLLPSMAESAKSWLSTVSTKTRSELTAGAARIGPATCWRQRITPVRASSA